MNQHETDIVYAAIGVQSPTAREPNATSKITHNLIPTLRKRANVCKVGSAFESLRVPLKHGIDRLRNLGAAPLVNTAGVDPDPFSKRQGRVTQKQ